MNLWAWRKAGRDNPPPVGETAALYLHPWRLGQARRCDIGRAYVPDGMVLTYWESAFGIESDFDGRSFREILRDYEVWYAVLPPLPRFHGADIRKDR